MLDDRNRIIVEGIKQGKNIQAINRDLAMNDYGEFNPVVDLGKNFLRNAEEFGRDFATATGAVAKPIMEAGDEVYRAPLNKKAQAVRDAFVKTIRNKDLQRTSRGALVGGVVGSFVPALGTVGGATLGGSIGLSGGPKEFADAMLSTYNTSVDDIIQGRVDPRNVLAGIYENPFYAGLDIGGGPVAKKIGEASHTAGKAISKNAPTFIQQLFPSTELRDFNRTITESLEGSKARHADLYKSVNTLETMPMANREEIVKNITMNIGKLSKEEKIIADSIKKDLRNNEAMAIKLGLLDATSSKMNTVSQYVMGKLGNKIQGLVHDDIVNLISGNELRPEAKALIGDGKEILQAIKEGDKLYKEGKISFLTQKLSPSRDETGLIRARDFNKGKKNYFDINRIVGRTEADKLANVLEESIKFQLGQVGKPNQVMDLINRMIDEGKFGKQLQTELKSMPKGKKALDIDLFRQSIKESLSTTGEADIQKALKDANKPNKGAILIDEIYGKAIDNAFKPVKNTLFRKLTNSMKKAQLAQPHWLSMNRFGNFSNNIAGGVSLSDYADTLNLKNILPDKLKQQTAFSSYIGEGIEEASKLKGDAVLGKPLTNIKKSWGRFKQSNKSLEDIGKFVGELYSDTSDIVANPAFRFESILERTDRYANFIRQAKIEAKRTGKNYKDIIKKSNTDEKLFDKLNREVNKDLGDYIGKNYLIPQGVYDVASLGIPYYRFLTQTGRTTLHQMANHPLAFHSIINAPARVGREGSEYILNENNLNPEFYEGGIPYKETPWDTTVTVGIEPLPAQAVSRDLARILSGKQFGSITSPLITMGGDIISYRKGNRIPTSKGLTNVRFTRPSEADRYEPTAGERVRYALNQLLSNTYAPYRLSQKYGREALAALTGSGLQSRYDIESFTENPESFRRTTANELLGRWFGLQTNENYPRFEKRASKKDIRKAKRNIKKAEMKSKYKG